MSKIFFVHKWRVPLISNVDVGTFTKFFFASILAKQCLMFIMILTFLCLNKSELVTKIGYALY